MKISIIKIISIYILFSLCISDAQDQQPDAEKIKGIILIDVPIAAKMANIEDNASLVQAFADLGVSQKNSFNKVYSSVPRKDWINRLALYLATKNKIKGIKQNTTASDLGDFNWAYLATDVKFLPIMLDSPGSAKLTKIEFANIQYDFIIKGEGFQPGTSFLIPIVANQKNTNINATFILNDKIASWSGDTTIDILKIVSANTSKGCEIYINSQPSNATIYFNKKKWYALTNTSSVRDPGIWEVEIYLEGYKEWSGKQELKAGESWTINVDLIKQ